MNRLGFFCSSFLFDVDYISNFLFDFRLNLQNLFNSLFSFVISGVPATVTPVTLWA